MKIFNKFTTALMVLPVLAAFTACSDDDEYTAAEKLNSAQVYFSKDLPETVNLEMGNSSFQVQINRIKTEGALTVKLKAEQDEAAIFDVPASVSFADGAATANITVNYPASAIVYDEMHDMTISIDDEAYTTPYGKASYIFTVGAPSPLTPWVSNPNAFAAAGGIGEFPIGKAGTGTYTYAQYASGTQEGLKIYMRQNTAAPNIVQFRIDRWGAGTFTNDGVTLMLDGEWDEENGVYRLTTDTGTGYVSSNYNEEVLIADMLTYSKYRLANGANPDNWTFTWEQVPSFYDPETGRFSLYVAYYISLGYFGAGYEYFQMDGFYVPDYSATLAYKGVLTGDDSQVFASAELELGVDAQDVRAIVMTQDADASAVADAIAAGELEAIDVQAGRIDVPFDPEELGDPKLQLIVAVINEGEVITVSTAKFEYYGGSANPWVSLGVGYYTDDIVASLYGEEPPTYEVEIKTSTETPGIYRIMNAYSNSVYPFAEDDCAEEGTYLEVVAEDPEGVYIPTQSLGFDWGDGEFMFASWGAYNIENGNSFEDVKEAGLLGKIADGVISFPVFTNSNGKQYQGIVFLGSKGYYCGLNGKFEIVLPTSSAFAKTMARAKANIARHNARKLQTSCQMKTSVFKKTLMLHTAPISK